MQPKEEVRFVRRLSTLLRTKGRIPKQLEPAASGELKHVGEWGWQENIVGVALGWKGRRKTPCLTLFVRWRLGGKRLSSKQFVPEGFRIPENHIDVLTDIVEVRETPRLHAFNGIARSGKKIGHEHGILAPGSTGILLESTAPGDEHVYVLGSAHVMALPRRGMGRPMAGQFVEQPFNPSADPIEGQVATLTEHFSDLTIRATQTDDFAIARLLPGVQWDKRMNRSERTVTSLSTLGRSEDFSEGMEFVHFGASNGPSRGLVQFTEGSFTVASFGASRFAEWTYQGLVPYNAPAGKGDSGGAVLAAGTSRLVGIHTGGFDTVDLGFFFPIGPRLAKLGFRPVTDRPNPAR